MSRIEKNQSHGLQVYVYWKQTNLGIQLIWMFRRDLHIICSQNWCVFWYFYSWSAIELHEIIVPHTKSNFYYWLALFTGGKSLLRAIESSVTILSPLIDFGSVLEDAWKSASRAVKIWMMSSTTEKRSAIVRKSEINSRQTNTENSRETVALLQEFILS